MNIDDLARDAEEWREDGNAEYADAIEELISKFSEIEQSEHSIQRANNACRNEQDDFNLKWSDFPKVNVY